MHFSSIIAPLALLAVGVNAATLKRDDLHVVDFRSFGAPGCDAENQGIWTFTQSQLTGCKTFASFDAQNVQAISLVDIMNGCSCKPYPRAPLFPFSLDTLSHC